MYDEERDEQIASPEVSDADEKLLEEIRETYRYYSEYWSKAREERAHDMRVICGDPWDPADRKARNDAKRPVINHDEINQYINQAIGNALANKRGIKVEPDGEGADEKTAEYRQNRIRAIEYRSQAQSTYIGAYRAMLEGSYGFWRLKRQWIKGKWSQEILIRPIPNPDSVLYDPDCKEPDWSDAEGVFVVEPMARAAFKRKYPKAKRTSFSPDDMRVEYAADWIRDGQILVCEYWKVIKTERQIKSPDGKKTRTEEDKRVVQYVTNGFEILEENEEPGEEIPIISCIGLERYADLGKGPERILFSAGRLACEPQLSLAYLVSQQMEESGLSPKSPLLGYVGQFETDKEALETSHKIPHPFLQFDPAPDSAGGQILPLPHRESFTPNFAGYEVAKDSCRRAIQAAMGISPLPTAAQRNNEKSGVALKKISEEQQTGTSHFLEGYERAIQRTGRIIESWLPTVDDTETEVPIRMADDTHRMVRINTDEPYVNEKGEQEHYPVQEAPHATTISVGPSSDSQRDAADQFAESLVTQLPLIAQISGPPQAAKLLGLVIKLRQLGPLGDQMAELIAPDQQQQMPPQAQQALSQAEQHLQAINAYAQKVEQENQELKQEKAAKIVDNEYKLKLEDKRLENQLAIAEVTTKAQNLEERTKFLEDMWKEFHTQAHEVGLQAQEQEHERNLTDQQGQITQQQQAQQQQADQEQQDQQPQAA